MTALSHGVLGIAAERRRQIEEKGWSFAHDDDHKEHELLEAAGCYLFAARWADNADVGGRLDLLAYPPTGWPWEKAAWKPSTDPLRNLAKAGALIAAEMDRIRRHRVEAFQHVPTDTESWETENGLVWKDEDGVVHVEGTVSGLPEAPG